MELALHRVGRDYRTAQLVTTQSNAKLVFRIESGLQEMRAHLQKEGVVVGEIKRYPGFSYSLCDGPEIQKEMFSTL